MSSGTDSTPPGSGGARKGGFVPPSTADLDAILEQYEFIELLGRGGMGAVYKARQKSLDRLVALKILPPHLTNDGEEQGFHFAERFQREARAMARLSHPHIIGVYDFGQAKDGQFYFVMEYVEGTDLHALIKTGQLTPAHVAGWMSQICDALQYAHAKGIVHRDIKPANIMITRESQVKVADFGLAKLTGAGELETKLTMTNMAMGTPDYVAPEALEMNVEIDHRADLYAVGVMLYEMLTGKVPRGAWKPASTQIPNLDSRYDDLIERAMDTDREGRFQQASEISAILYEIVTTPPKPAASGRRTLLMGDAACTGPVKPPRPKEMTRPQTPVVGGRSAAPSDPLPRSKSPVGPIIGLAAGAAAIGLAVFLIFRPKAEPVPEVASLSKSPGEAAATALPDPVPLTPDSTAPSSDPVPPESPAATMAPPTPVETSAPSPDLPAPIVTPHPTAVVASSAPAMATPAPYPTPASAPDPTPAPVPDPTPAPVPDSPDVPADPRVAQLEAGFQAAYLRDAEAPYDKAIAALKQSYLGALARARTAALTQGDLDLVTSLDDEKSRIEGGRALPPADVGGTPAALIQLRETYRNTAAKHLGQRDSAAAPLFDKYVGALDLYVSELTRANALDQARLIKAYRETIGGRRSKLEVPPTAAAMVKSTATKATATTDGGTAIRGSRWYEAAKWVISVGGTMHAVRDGQEFPIASEEDIPNGPFDIQRVEIIANPKATAITEDDFSRLAPLRELKGIRMQGIPVGDAAFAFALTTPELDTFSVIGNSKLTDAVFDQIASLEGLKLLQFQSSTGVTGAGLEKLASLPRMEAIWLDYTGLTDEGIKQLGGATSVKELVLDGTPITDAGLSILPNLKKLQNLNIGSCPGVSGSSFVHLAELKSLSQFRWTHPKLSAPDAIASIGQCHSLNSLVLDAVPISDRDLALLAPLTNLTALNLPSTRVTGTGFKDLAGFSALISLDVSGEAPITPEGLQAIATSLPRLEGLAIGAGAVLKAEDFQRISGLKVLGTLRIVHPAFDDTALASVELPKPLKIFDATATPLTAAGIAPLKSLENLTILNLSYCPAIDDAAIAHLKEMRFLTEIHLAGTGVTEAGAAALKEALPRCTIIR